MTITVGYYTGEKNYAKKKYTAEHKYTNCVLKDNTSVRHPTILIQTSASGVKNLVASSHPCNYMYIPDFGRYYYIQDIRSIRGHLVEIDAISDPLKSFWSQIKQNIGYVDQTATTAKRSKYLDDGSFRAYSTPNISTDPFEGDQFTSTRQFVAIISGGTSSES